MSDPIDRQAVIDQLHQSYNLFDAEHRIEDLPSAPDPPEWVHTVERYLQNVPNWIVNPIEWALYQSWKEYRKKTR